MTDGEIKKGWGEGREKLRKEDRKERREEVREEGKKEGMFHLAYVRTAKCQCRYTNISDLVASREIDYAYERTSTSNS